MWRSCVSPGLREAKAATASLLLLAVVAARSSPEVPDAAGEGSDQAAAVPMAPAGAGFSAVVLNETRRWLGSFQMCVPCTCCGDPRGVCVLSPCCYAINCNIPNRPFRFCSFPPRRRNTPRRWPRMLLLLEKGALLQHTPTKKQNTPAKLQHKTLMCKDPVI